MAGLSLLPKKAGSFADAAYWRQFFKKRGQKAFEWYGSYAEIGHSLEKYLKPSDRILQIGCGNSTLADDLYDNGFRRVISIDIVEDVIQQQVKKNTALRPELEYHVVDVTVSVDSGSDHMQASSYQAVLDKGTLDALLPPDFDREKESAVLRMFERVDRILATGGRYLVVTLAQPEVIAVWVRYFSQRPYMLRVQQVNSGSGDSDTGWKLPTFLLVATKLKTLDHGKRNILQIYEFLEFGRSSPRRLSGGDDLLEAVKSAQSYAIFCDKARRGDIGDDMQIDFYTPTSTNAKYIVHLTKCDEVPKRVVHQYAIFVVPQGREHEWLFSTPKGRRELCTQASARQLAVVLLGRDHEFPSLDAVKNELDERVMDFAPSDVPKQEKKHQVPYLSLGEHIGRRVVVCNGTSDFSGDYVIEDVSHDDEKTSFRRLVFLKSQNLIQSEAKLLKAKARGKRQSLIDWNHLCCDHHKVMLAALAVPKKTDSISVCLLGLGGGCLATFILKHFPEATVTAVELDPTVVDIAHKYFEFPEESARLKCVIGDGLNFIQEESQSDGHFDVVLLDVAGDSHVDGLSCPLPSFVEEDNLKRYHDILGPNGVLALNLVARDEAKREELKKRIFSQFPQHFVHRIADEVNEVLLCFCEHRNPEWLEGFQKRLLEMYRKLRTQGHSGSDMKLTDSCSVDKLLERIANF